MTRRDRIRKSDGSGAGLIDIEGLWALFEPRVREALRSLELRPWPRQMNYKTAAAYLDMTEAQLRQAVSRGWFPKPRHVYGDHGTLVFDRDVLDRWCEERRVA